MTPSPGTIARRLAMIVSRLARVAVSGSGMRIGAPSRSDPGVLGDKIGGGARVVNRLRGRCQAESAKQAAIALGRASIWARRERLPCDQMVFSLGASS